MRSLPGERASRDRVVTESVGDRQAAQTRATTTPWFVRKLLKGNPPRCRFASAARGSSRARSSEPDRLLAQRRSGQTRAQSIVPPRSTPVTGAAPASACRLICRAPTAGRCDSAGPGRATGLPRAARRRPPRCAGTAAARRAPPPGLGRRRCAGSPRRPARRRGARAPAAAGARWTSLRVGHLQLRERVPQRRRAPAGCAARASPSAPRTASIASRTCSRSRSPAPLARRRPRGAAEPACAEVEQRDRRLGDHVGRLVMRLSLGLVGGSQLLLASARRRRPAGRLPADAPRVLKRFTSSA